MKINKTKLKILINKFLCLIGNLYSNTYGKLNLCNVVYVVEKKNWSIFCDGMEISQEINKKIRKNFCEVSTRPYLYNNKIIHFGSQYMWIDWYKYLPKTNKYVVNFYHGKHEDGLEIAKHIDEFLMSVTNIDIILTASSLIMERLIKWGVPKEKIVLIPIGVNTKMFKPPSKHDKNKIRQLLNVSSDEFLIGSFQKDGNGWEEGLEPKLIKGPDIFVEVVKLLSKKLKVRVLLTGPARGFVKNELKSNNIEYLHYFLNSHEDIVKYYQALDLYLITSREEGGPKGVIEGLSCGVCVVTTNVGMARDLIKNKKIGILVNSFKPEIIFNNIIEYINNKFKLDQKEMRKSVKKTDWEQVASEHLYKIYNHLKK